MKLIALRCPNCNQALEAGQLDDVVQCPNCFRAVGLRPTGMVLEPIRVAAASREEPDGYLPVWVFEGRVNLVQRTTQGGAAQDAAARAMWDKPRRFYVPGWQLTLAEAKALTLAWVRNQPLFKDTAFTDEVRFPPVVIAEDDARKLLALVVATIEAERRDFIKELDFSIDISGRTLWLLPARQAKGQWELLPL